MTQLLERAFAEAAKLPAPDQNEFAEWILNALSSERRWAEAFAGSQDVLAMLADEALAEHRQGRTLLLDPESL